MSDSSVKPGGVLAGCGCIFAISPIIMAAVSYAFNGGPDAWHWYLVTTFPIGGVMVITGLILAAVGAIKGATKDSTSTAESDPTAGDAESDPTAGDAP